MKKTLFLSAMLVAVQAFAGTPSTISVDSNNSPYNLDAALNADGKITLTMANGTTVKNETVGRNLTSVQIGEMTLAREGGADAPEVTVQVATNKQYGILNNNYADASLTLNGGTINKTGAGTFLLVNTHVENTDSGKINVNAGTLSFNKPGSGDVKDYSFEGTGVDVTVASGAAVNVEGTKVALKSLTLNSGARLNILANTTVTGSVTASSGSEIMFSSDQYNNYIAAGTINSEKLNVTDTTGVKIGITGGSSTAVVDLNNAVSNNTMVLVGATGKIQTGNTITTDLVLGNTNSANEWHIIGGEEYEFAGTLSNYASNNAGNLVFNGDLAAGSTDTREVTLTFTGDMSGWTSNSTNWGGLRAAAGASVNVTIGGEATSDVKNAFNADAVTQQNNKNGYIYLTMDRSAALKGTLRINSLTVNSGKIVTTTDGAFVVKNSIAVQDNAKLTMASTGAKTTESLTLGSGATLTLGSENSHNINLTTNKLTVGGNSTLNANLVIADGGTLDFSASHVLTMGCTVTIGDNVTVILDAAEIAAIRNGQELVIIDSVDGDNINQAISLGTGIKIYDTNNNWISDLSLEKTNSKTEAGTFAVVVAPEPATATLSLLALAALASRRKRH